MKLKPKRKNRMYGRIGRFKNGEMHQQSTLFPQANTQQLPPKRQTEPTDAVLTSSLPSHAKYYTVNRT